MSRTIQILTPDNVEIEYRLAGVGVRGAAAGIDLLIQGLLLLIPGGILGWILYQQQPDEATLMTAIGIFLLLYGVINYGYFIISDLVFKGQTLGKKLYHIRVIRDNGEGITPAHAMIREFLRSTIDPLGIGFILIFLNKRNKRLGDIMASTIVVEEESHKIEELDTLFKTTGAQSLTQEEIELVRDYITRMNQLDETARFTLESKLVQYFKMKLDINDEIIHKEAFIRGLL